MPCTRSKGDLLPEVNTQELASGDAGRGAEAVKSLAQQHGHTLDIWKGEAAPRDSVWMGLRLR